MKIYYLFDKLSKTIINVFLSENIDTALRAVKCMIENFKQANNAGALIQIKDCELKEIKTSDDNFIVDVKDLIKENSEVKK